MTKVSASMLIEELRCERFTDPCYWRWQTVKDRQRKYDISDEQVEDFCLFNSVRRSQKEIEDYIWQQAEDGK